MTITDPYIRLYHQVRNLMELIEAIAKSKSLEDEVKLQLITIEHDEPDKAQIQLKNLYQVKQAAESAGIMLDVAFDNTRTIHDRSIVTDTGWKILLGRGLDIFQHVGSDSFDLATRVQEFRQVKGFGVTYVRV